MKKVLIVVDFQNDFVDGSLGFENANKLDEVIYSKIKEYKENGDDIIFTFDTHYEDYLDTFEGKNLPVKHCIKGTFGHNLYGKVATLCDSNDKCFEKNTFPSLDLANYLKQCNYKEVELCGLVSNICVISNAIMVKSALPNASIIIDSKATDSFDKVLHEQTLNVLKGLQIIVK